MKKIKTILVDDEFLALQLLEEFIHRMPQLEIIAKVKSATAAMEVLASQEIDLMFLDIQMPNLSGNDFLKSLENPPVTIFTTAYSDYALEAFSLNVVDYLLKPFSFERFEQAVKKAKEKITPQKEEIFITLKSDGVLHKIYTKDIRYIEGMKEYAKIVCTNKKIVILDSLKNLEDLLPKNNFFRIHKSYIANKSHINTLEGYQVRLGKDKLPISRAKKAEIAAWVVSS